MALINKNKKKSTSIEPKELLSLENSDIIEDVTTDIIPEEIVKEETILDNTSVFTDSIEVLARELIPTKEVEQQIIDEVVSSIQEDNTSVFTGQAIEEESSEENIEIVVIKQKPIPPPTQILKEGADPVVKKVVIEEKKIIYSFTFIKEEEEVTFYSEGIPVFVKDKDEKGIQFTKVFRKVILSENILGKVKVAVNYKEKIPDTLFLSLTNGIFIKTITEESWMSSNKEIAEAKFNKTILEQYRKVSESLVTTIKQTTNKTIISKESQEEKLTDF